MWFPDVRNVYLARSARRDAIPMVVISTYNFVKYVGTVTSNSGF